MSGKPHPAAVVVAALLMGAMALLLGSQIFKTVAYAVEAPTNGQPVAPPAASAAQPEEQAPPAPSPAPAAEPAAPAVPDDHFVIRRVLPIDGPIEFGTYYWDAEGVPEGELVITIDLEAQTLSVFREGYEIGATAILYGSDEKPTPLGNFTITEKDADHVSNLYGAPMPFMLRLTNDGISIHGSEVEWGYATHGCIGVPVEFAELLFDLAALGDRVIITQGERITVGDAIAPAQS
ncbi:L,D-transpeptidase family protein [Sphingosinithalassobacter sp. CS137]|uniref:L,D-transpeptidase family protein n=1 Tax=Sphingosinithalassobacter sp. CS137 TaxID=2762748 RepID=UPI0021D090BD|nr:L,D-transpeptidase family protein [Sphingosinithalassobacter sp. CS137]